MRMAERFCCALAAGLILCTVARAADTLESVEKKIIAQAEKTKAISAKMSLDTEVQGKQMQTMSRGEGTYEYARRDDKVLSRTEIKSSNSTKVGDRPEKKENGRTLVIADGQFTCTLNENGNRKVAVKTQYDPAQSQISGKDMWNRLREGYDLKLMPAEKVEGKEVFVIQGRPKKARKGMTQQLTYCFAKDSGVLVKSVTETTYGSSKSKIIFTLTAVRLNPDLKPERFVFKAPDDAQIMDMTGAKDGKREP